MLFKVDMCIVQKVDIDRQLSTDFWSNVMDKKEM